MNDILQKKFAAYWQDGKTNMGVSKTFFLARMMELPLQQLQDQAKKEWVRKRMSRATYVEKQGTIQMNVMWKTKTQLKWRTRKALIS